VERIRQGLDLNEIAARTKISARFLQAIEAGDFSEIPGSFFARSFLRQYASVLGMDWAELERDLNEVVQPEAPAYVSSQVPERPVTDIPPISTPAARRNGAAIKRTALSFVVFVLVMVACSVIYSVWERFQRAPDTGKAVIAHQQAVEVPPAPPAPQAPPTEPDVRQASQPQTGGGPALDLSATEETWVSVSSSGKTVFMGILKPNETKALEGIQSAKLLIGNAGGLAVRWNGKPLGPLGPRGQVRIVELTPDSVQVSLPHKAQKEGAQL
jgi:cytoskeletal protein RodZ